MSNRKKQKNPKKNSQLNPHLAANFKNQILQFLDGKGYHPLTEKDLAERLHVYKDHLKVFGDVLESMVQSQEIEKLHLRFSLHKSTRKIVTGIIRIHPRGFGFLQPENIKHGVIEEVFIPKHCTKNAVDGDTVEVVVDELDNSPKGPEGRVVTVLKRGRTHIAGTVYEFPGNNEALVYVPLFGIAKRVAVKLPEDYPLHYGDRIIMKVLDWGEGSDCVKCEKSHYMGNINDPSCDVTAAIEEYDLKNDFPSSVLKEAAAYGKSVKRSEITKREDLRQTHTCFTIDPDTAKDFDDALSLTLSNGHYYLGVHIADVSHYVQSGTHLDIEAQKRCNSTYFPGNVVPMLPEELSNELCSLKPNVNRLTLSVFMEFDEEGTLVNSRIARTVIKSVKRFTYREALAVLEGKASPHSKALNMMVDLCRLLKKKRAERGSVEFALPEYSVWVDRETGEPKHIDKIEYDITHQLVEEFMLKANETVATYLSSQDKELAFRVHDEPNIENMREFADLARMLGFKIQKNPTPNDLQILFKEVATTPFAQQLAVAFIRSMKLAYYSPNNMGHYGLGLKYYCHFTSPIRRYIDLVIHRIVCGEVHDEKTLAKITQHCSDQERISAKAENSVIMLKKIRLLKKWSDAGKDVYTAVITKIKNAGIIFDIQDLMLEGFIHISEIGNEYYHFDQNMHTLTGDKTRAFYRSGQKIQVKLKELNLITLDCSWELLKTEPSKKNKKNTTEKKLVKKPIRTQSKPPKKPLTKNSKKTPSISKKSEPKKTRKKK
ncbi:MAG: ribonuclease R [Parachlamydiales bacterium]|nr:ribonuclease R [Parachlamydiales bacterium]